MKIIRVNMSELGISIEPVPTQYLNLGGRGLSLKILSDEVNPGCYALGKDNKLIIAPGMLVESTAPCSGRTSIGAKSPLTGTIKESNVGGIAGQYLAAHGIKALVIEGQTEDKHCRVLVINENATEISGERLSQFCNEHGGRTGHACSRGCVIRCSNVFNDSQGNYVTAALEYETIGLLGSNCGLNDLDSIARLDRLCDDLGIDNMEMGVTLGVAMEAGLIPFGNFEAMKETISCIATGDYLGRILGQGAAVTGRVFGVERVPTVKGQGLSAYDPRVLKGTGVIYATSTMGADHTAGNCLPGRGGLNCQEPGGQVNLSREIQIMSMVCDILGLCVFVGPLEENMPIMKC